MKTILSKMSLDIEKRKKALLSIKCLALENIFIIRNHKDFI